MDEVRCDEKDFLIWKWRPASGSSGRENAIRRGSSLRVREGQVAVFVWGDGRGQAVDYFIGPRDVTLVTKNLPNIFGQFDRAMHGGTSYPAEVYFINLADVIQVRFGVPYFEAFDSRLPDFGVPVAVRGTMTFRIADYQEFILQHRLEEFDLEDFKNQIRAAIGRYVRTAVSNLLSERGVSLVRLGSAIGDLNDFLLPVLRRRFEDDFAIRVTGLDVSDIELDNESESYRLYMAALTHVHPREHWISNSEEVTKC